MTTRRNFLKLMGGGAAVSAVLPSIAEAQSSPPVTTDSPLVTDNGPSLAGTARYYSPVTACTSMTIDADRNTTVTPRLNAAIDALRDELRS